MPPIGEAPEFKGRGSASYWRVFPWLLGYAFPLQLNSNRGYPAFPRPPIHWQNRDVLEVWGHLKGKLRIKHWLGTYKVLFSFSMARGKLYQHREFQMAAEAGFSAAKLKICSQSEAGNNRHLQRGSRRCPKPARGFAPQLLILSRMRVSVGLHGRPGAWAHCTGNCCGLAAALQPGKGQKMLRPNMNQSLLAL